MPLLQIKDIRKTFEGQPLLQGISFDMDRGEIACLLGPSGSGKTTLLRIISGLEKAESGSVIFEGAVMSGVPTHQRGFGLMFQDLALFPHRNVFDNVAFGLRMKNVSSEVVDSRVHEGLDLVGLAGFAARDVNQLSGGEQQRVALARALAPRPRLLMFDEPMGALDRILREQLVTDLRRILKKLELTSLYVTHDQNEAFAIADRVLIINQGQIVQSGTPGNLYEHPASAFVARFLGFRNLIPGSVAGRRGDYSLIRTAAGTLVIAAPSYRSESDVLVLIRPDAAADVVRGPADRQENAIVGQVLETRFQVGRPQISVDAGQGVQLVFNWDGKVEVGSHVTVILDPAKVTVFERGAHEAE